VAALNWVRSNYRRFWWRPGNVTVFGESAGAVAVRTLLSCPRAQRIVSSRVIQSAGFERPAFAKSWSYERAQAAANPYLKDSVLGISMRCAEYPARI